MDNRGKNIVFSKYILGDTVKLEKEIGEIIEIYFSRYEITYAVSFGEEVRIIEEEKIIPISVIYISYFHLVEFPIGEFIHILKPTFATYDKKGYIMNFQVTKKENWYLIYVGNGVGIGQSQHTLIKVV